MDRNNPALTYTLDDFISMKIADDMTYYKFSIIEVINGIQHLDHNIIEEYIDELKNASVWVELSSDEMKKYKYNPDRLAYDIYKSVQLDFVIMLLNDTYDPKEFDKPKILLPRASVLSEFLNKVYSTEYGYITQNRADNSLPI